MPLKTSKITTSVLLSGMLLSSGTTAVLAAENTANNTQSEQSKTIQQVTAKPTSTRGYVVENTTTVDLSKASSAAYKVALPDGFTFNLSMSKDGVSAQGSIFDATGSNFNDNQILLGDANYLQANTTMQYFVKVGSTWHLRALKFVNNKATAGVKDFYFDTTTLDQSALADKYDAIKQTIAPGVDVKINATASKDIVEMATIQYMITAEGTNVPDFNYEGVNEHQGYVTSPAYSNTKETTFTFSYFNEQGQMMTAVLHFQKNDVKPVAQPVTVNYVDANGQKLADSDTLKGNVGASYQTAAKTIAGYHVVTTPANAKGTFTDKAQTVTYTYEKDTVTTPAAKAVTVNYVDANGQKLAASETLNGKVGAAYQTTAKTIAGYHVAQTPANANGTFTDKAQTVTYTYEKDAVTTPAAKAVTVKYVDANGKEIAKADVLTGQLNAAYQTAAKTIAGYKLVKTPANAKGQYTTSAQTVVYEYQKKTTTTVPTTSVKMTARYVDEQGHELVKSITKTGQQGDHYKASAAAIKGYQLIAMPKNAAGILGKDDITIKFVYRKVTTNHQTPNQNQQVKPNNDKHQVTKPNNYSKGKITTTKPQPQAVKKQLPKTGVANPVLLSVLGTVLALSAVVLGFYRKLRKSH
ncbi:MucBP domain-containing protein [Latilactobacillus sakei]